MNKSRNHVRLYTDGACRGNPGPGGFGLILINGKHPEESKAAYRLTTNNRMELMPVIVGLSKLEKECRVDVYTDSKLIVDAFNKRWINKWIANGWIKSDDKPVKNADLWSSLYSLAEIHDVTFHWVKGHNGHPMNERCDELANQAIDENLYNVDGGCEGRN
jgi:ribonuclease HI